MKKISHILVTVLSLASVALFVFLIKKYPAEEILGLLSKVGLIHILILLGLTIVYLSLYTIRWKRILKLEGYDISFKDLLSYRLAGYSFSYLTPLADYGGEPVVAYLMNKDNPKLSFSKSFASVIASRIISAIPESFFLIISISYVLFFLVLPAKINFIFYILLGIVTLLLLFIYYIILKKRHPLSKIIYFLKLDKLSFIKKNMSSIKNFDDLLNNLFHDHPKELLINVSLSFLALTSIISMFWLLARNLGIHLNFAEAITARSITSVIGSLVPVPANIGIGEGSESAWFSAIGFGAAQGFGFYLLIRAKDILITTAGIIVLINKGFLKNINKIKEILRENNFLKNLLPKEDRENNL